MGMQFTPGWNRPKLATTAPYDSGMNSKAKKKFKYTLENNLKRIQGKVYLAFFSEADITRALHHAVGRFTDPPVSGLLADCFAKGPMVTIDQGTHQTEDRAGGGFKLHFDARPPGGKCFHLYVGQDSAGHLVLTEASYSAGGGGFARVYPN